MLGSEMIAKVSQAPNGLNALYIATSSLFGKGVSYR
jgi:hypothetical protein